MKLISSGKGITFPDSTVQRTAALECASTVVGTPVGGQSENGSSLLSKPGSTKDASHEKPYLLKIEPGIYDIGENNLSMKSFVDVEGSGETTTLIKKHPSSPGVIVGRSAADALRTGGRCIVDIRLSRLVAVNAGVWKFGIYNDHSSVARLLYSEVEAYGGKESWGILNSNTAGDLYVDHSVTIGGNKGMRDDSGSASVVVGAGRVSGTKGMVQCAGVYDASYNFNPTTCP